MPIKLGDEIEVKIEDLTPQGQGRASLDGFVIFVNEGLPGETCLVQITLKKKRYAVADIISILTPSPEREGPFCPVYGTCGGCQLQHLNFEHQLPTKARGVLETLQRIGHIDASDLPMTLHRFEPSSFGDANPMAYRCKVQYAIAQAPQGIELGFYARGTHDVVHTPSCGIQPSVFDALKTCAEQLWTSHALTVYDEATGHGLLRRLLLRASWAHRTIMVTVVVNGTELPYFDELIRAWEEILQLTDWTLHSVYHNEHTKQNNRVSGPVWKHIRGEERLVETLAGLLFEIQPASFFQVNPVIAEKMFLRIAEIAGELNASTILDLYCGGGTLGLVTLKHLPNASLRGIEIVPQAVEDARLNAERNGLSDRAEFINAPAEDVLDETLRSGEDVDLLIVDPPRKGYDAKLIDAILRSPAPHLIYVSCHPATLARDLKQFVAGGFEVQSLDVLDMFPATSHVETVVLMSR